MIKLRLGIMKLAIASINALGLDFPDCKGSDVNEWKVKVVKSGGKRRLRQETKWAANQHFRGLINRSNIMPHPSDMQGYAYGNSRQYLAIRFVEFGCE